MKYKQNGSGWGKGYNAFCCTHRLGHISVATEYNTPWQGRCGGIVIGGSKGIEKVFITQQQIEEVIKELACE